jgi:hypothetical protein
VKKPGTFSIEPLNQHRPRMCDLAFGEDPEDKADCGVARWLLTDTVGDLTDRILVLCDGHLRGLGVTVCNTVQIGGWNPLPMLLLCPKCHTQHIDEGVWATRLHRTHLCASCDHQWRPANVPTVGVAVLPIGETP